MSNLFLTLIIAFVVIILALAALAIGWLFTGRCKTHKNGCCRGPIDQKEECCKTISPDSEKVEKNHDTPPTPPSA